MIFNLRKTHTNPSLISIHLEQFSTFTSMIYTSFKLEFKILAENASRTQNCIFIFNHFDLLSQNTIHGLYYTVMKQNDLLNNSMKSV